MEIHIKLSTLDYLDHKIFYEKNRLKVELHFTKLLQKKSELGLENGFFFN